MAVTLHPLGSAVPGIQNFEAREHGQRLGSARITRQGSEYRVQANVGGFSSFVDLGPTKTVRTARKRIVDFYKARR